MAVLTNRTSGCILATRAQVAEGVWRRAVGLLSRRSFPEGEALIFPRCRSLHTWFMRFPIDVIFLKDGVVVKLAQRLGPFRVVWAPGADTAIELPEGTIARTDIRAGERLDVGGTGGPQGQEKP